ncbi:hypothetical protein DPV78_004415 [Talaromyces pinophilus]|nr:hypothetical protein DPV78_004415 [Talaromyces pinophilus]
MWSLKSNSTALAVALNGIVALGQTITVNPSTTYQTIDGFGFSEAFGFGAPIASASASIQTQVTNYLFSTTTGAGLTILRNRIAAGSGSIEPNAPSGPNAQPTYTWDGNDAGQVWWSKQARAKGVKYIYADAWSAPAFMKTNDNVANGGYLCGTTGETCSSGDWRQAYANYLVQYIKDYANEGITIDFVGWLNEPDYSPNYDSMLITSGTQAASFIPTLYNTIKSAGLSTGIACCDPFGWSDAVTWTAQLASAGATQYLARITSHWYASKGTSPINTSLRVWETEYADLDDAFTTTWYSSGAANEGLTWANLIWQGVVEADLSAFLYWIGAQSNSNAAGLVTLNGSTVQASGTLWAFAMFSRFIRPDAVRISTSGSPSNVNVGAFKNADGSIVVIAINNNGNSETISLSGITASKVSAYYMDSAVSSPSTFSATLNGGTVGGSLPARSMVTFVITTGSSGSATTTTTKTSSTFTTSTSSTTTSTSSGAAQEWGQCGGQGWTGPTTCVSPYVCTYSNAYYSQCLPA